MLAHEICERFDNLCDALRSSSTKGPDLALNSRLSDDLVAFADVWEKGAYVQQQQALDVLAYLQDFLIDSKKQQAEHKIGEHITDLRAAPATTVAFRKALWIAVEHTAGRTLKERDVKRYPELFETLPMLMYVHQLGVKDSPFRGYFVPDNVNQAKILRRLRTEMGLTTEGDPKENVVSHRYSYLVKYLVTGSFTDIPDEQVDHLSGTVKNLLRTACEAMCDMRSDKAVQWRGMVAINMEVQPDLFVAQDATAAKSQKAWATLRMIGIRKFKA